MSRVDAIRMEMAGAVRLLGEGGRNAAEENNRAARMTGLSIAVVERLRWKKLRRIPADVADAVRDAVNAANVKAEAKARHERQLFAAKMAALETYANSSTDPEFVRARAAGIVEQARRAGLLDGALAEAKGLGKPSGLEGGE